METKKCLSKRHEVIFPKVRQLMEAIERELKALDEPCLTLVVKFKLEEQGASGIEGEVRITPE